MREHNIGHLMNSFGWPGSSWISNHSSHLGGCLVFLWRDDIGQLNVIFSSSQLLHCIVTTNDTKWEISSIYGFNDEDGRRTIWEDIGKLHLYVSFTWLLVRDFNNVW